MPEGRWEQEGSTLVRRRPGAAPLELRIVDGRLRVGAVLLEGRRATDLSRQPGAVRALLTERGPEVEPDDINAVAERVARHLEEHDLWAPTGPRRRELTLVLLGGSFPLAAAAFAQGAGPLDEVPRWAEDVLRARSARSGARTAFGDRASRAVVSALAESLVPPRPDEGDATGALPLALGRLALARMAGEVLDADRLVAVLTAPGPYLPPPSWPDSDDVAEVARVARAFGPRRTRQVLVDAAGSVDGPARLVATARMWRGVRDHFQGRLPTGLDDLEALCRQLSPHDPVDRPQMLIGRTRPVPEPDPEPDPDAPPVAPRRRRPAVAPPTPAAPPGLLHPEFDEPPPVRPDHHRALRAPALRRGRQLHPTDAARAVDGLRVHDLTLRVARTDAQLIRWGETLRNCLGDFAEAVRDRRSVIIVIEQDLRIVASLEVAPDRSVRQFHGPANRVPAPRMERLVLDALVQHRVIEARPPH